MKFAGIQKMSLLDFPDKICATVFTKGCNFRCPFCHNAPLVIADGTYDGDELIDESEILSFLEHRKNMLDGICITGGEPLLQPEIESFIEKVRATGLAVKLDTNGSFPQKLKHILDNKLVDFVAMDIKNSPSRYAETVDVKNFDINLINESIDIISSSGVPYEFRTTVVREFHTEKDILDIGDWLKGKKRYCLQGFKDNGNNIKSGLTSYGEADLRGFAKQIEPFFDEVIVKV